MTLVIERKAGIQDEGRMGLRFIREENPSDPIIQETQENSDGTVTFAGYLLKWNDIAVIRDFFGEYKERFSKGAFTRTFKNNGPEGNSAIKLLRQHEQRFGTFLAGKFLDLHEDDTGPAFEAKTIRTDTGNNLAVEIREGVMNTMSVGFDSLREEYDKEKNLFTVKEARLYEASPVYWPAYESAIIENFRSVEQIPPTLARLLAVLEAGEELPEEVVGQLRMVHARIATILGGSRATTPAEDNQDDNRIEAAPGESHRADQELLTRLRLAEAQARL